MHYEYQNDDDDYDDDFAGSAISSPRTAIYYAVHIACGKRHKTVECPSVHQSVCLSHRWPEGLLLRSGAGTQHIQNKAAASPRHAGRVNFGPTVRRSNVGLLVNAEIISLEQFSGSS